MKLLSVALTLVILAQPGRLQCTSKACDSRPSGYSEILFEIINIKKQSSQILKSVSDIQCQSGGVHQGVDNKQNAELLKVVNETHKQSKEILQAVSELKTGNCQNDDLIQKIDNLQYKIDNLGTTGSSSPCTVNPATTVCQPCSVSKVCTTAPPSSITPTPAQDIPYDSSWTDCEDVYKSGHNTSGVYKVNPVGLSGPVNVYCDASEGGGWTIFQRRKDGSVSFNRSWSEYRNGFGDLNGEFWMGNELLYIMTFQNAEGSYLKVNTADFFLQSYYKTFSEFFIFSEAEKYKLHFGGSSYYAKPMRDNMNQAFSTWDQDNDAKNNENCAKKQGGGWWFNGCPSYAFLNGQYSKINLKNPHHIVWETESDWWPMKECEMKFRSVNYYL